MAARTTSRPALVRGPNYPTNTGGFLVISAKDDDSPELNNRRLDLATIAKGLQLMAEAAPSHFADFMKESEDANTGDVFLQLCLFGKEVFA